MRTKFYICRHCGNIVGMVKDAGVSIFCCGEKMQPIEPNTVEASNEKHIPVVSYKDGIVKVKVGEVAHPMVDEHFIQWVYLHTEKGGQRKALKPGDAPEIEFSVIDDKPIAVYAYCNLHGLWKADI